MSLSAPHLAIKKLAKYATSSASRAKDGVTILDGLHLLQEAAHHGVPQRLSHILYTDAAKNNTDVAAFLNEPHVATLDAVSEATMRKIALTKTPAGILGVYHIPEPPTELSADADCILLLDRIADPGNLGTIIRTAVAMNVDAIFCSPGCADVWSPKVLRAAQGAHFYTTIFRQFDLSTIKTTFDGRIIGTFLDPDATSLYKTDLTGRVGLCVGNEGAGIDPKEFAQYGDEKVFIPMTTDFESLNVSIATGMCLSEKRRQDLAQ